MNSRNTISVDQKGIYYALGSGPKLLYVLHGYGQLASYFIKKFEVLVPKGYTIIAPQGMHRFYLEGNNGRVGASWMTKEAREIDIENTNHFLNQLHSEIVAKSSYESVTVLGFSQGVATAFRWLSSGRIALNKLLLCSGMIPPDVDVNVQDSIYSEIEMTYFSGNKDIYRNEEYVKEFQERLLSQKLPIKMVEFNGGHTVDVPSVLKFL